MVDAKMKLEFFYDGDRWFLYPEDRDDDTDLAYVDAHPYRIDPIDLSGPWPNPSDCRSIVDVLCSRLQLGINTVIRVRDEQFNVIGWFGYFCGVELMRFTLTAESSREGVSHEG